MKNCPSHSSSQADHLKQGLNVQRATEIEDDVTERDASPEWQVQRPPGGAGDGFDVQHEMDERLNVGQLQMAKEVERNLAMLEPSDVKHTTRDAMVAVGIGDGGMLEALADRPEVIDALQRLSEREERVHKITRDIVVGLTE